MEVMNIEKFESLFSISCDVFHLNYPIYLDHQGQKTKTQNHQIRKQILQIQKLALQI